MRWGSGDGYRSRDRCIRWFVTIGPGRVDQFLPSCLSDPVAVIHAPSLCHSSATTTAAAPTRPFCILVIRLHFVMPRSDATGNSFDSPCRVANTSTTY